MSDPLFGADVIAPVVDDQDQGVDADFEAFKAKYVKEDNNVDVDALLKKAYHADLHISKIEPENADLRQQVERSLSYQDLLEKLQPRQPASNLGQPALGERGGNPPVAATDKDIEALVERTLSKKQQESVQVQNSQYVASELAKAWGSNFESKLRQKGTELGLSENRLRDMIRNEPKVILALALANQGQNRVENFTPPATQTRSTGNSIPKTRNLAYYNNMMKTDRKKWDSVAVQNEMHNSAIELGEAFFK